jgi:heparan-alpha-glucosaminide N-acetyltransferase
VNTSKHSSQTVIRAEPGASSSGEGATTATAAGVFPSEGARTPDNQAKPGANRLVSLDVFRGLVVAVMTLVNYLSSVKYVPAWAKHAPETTDGYTFVDVVFPAFLFMVGMAIPFALQRRLERGDSAVALGGKVLVRSMGLMLLGVITANEHLYAADAAVLSKPLWFSLALLCAMVLWSSGPGASRRVPLTPALSRGEREEGRRGSGGWRFQASLQTVAAVGLVVLLCLFRGHDEAGHLRWLQHSYWGMLGMIGWAYLTASICWLVWRDNSTALLGTLAFMLALYIGGRHGALDWLGPVQRFVDVGINFGTNPATVLMGVLVANCLRATGHERASSPKFKVPPASDSGAASQSPKPGRHLERVKVMVLMGVGFYLAGMLLRPLHGIHKSPHTEAYALVTGGICCVAFAAVYWLVDILQLRRGSGFLSALGQNALLAYLLPYLVGNLFGVFGRGVYWSETGWPGAACAAALTVFILGLTWWLTRVQIRLRL